MASNNYRKHSILPIKSRDSGSHRTVIIKKNIFNTYKFLKGKKILQSVNLLILETKFSETNLRITTDVPNFKPQKPFLKKQIFNIGMLLLPGTLEIASQLWL